MLKISELIREWKAEGRPGGRDEVLARLAASGGVYVPKFYDVSYDDSGAIASVVPNRPGVPDRVRKHTLMDLDSWPYRPSHWCRSPRRSTNGSPSRSSAAAPEGAASRPA